MPSLVLGKMLLLRVTLLLFLFSHIHTRVLVDGQCNIYTLKDSCICIRRWMPEREIIPGARTWYNHARLILELSINRKLDRELSRSRLLLCLTSSTHLCVCLCVCVQLDPLGLAAAKERCSPGCFGSYIERVQQMRRRARISRGLLTRDTRPDSRVTGDLYRELAREISAEARLVTVLFFSPLVARTCRNIFFFNFDARINVCLPP